MLSSKSVLILQNIIDFKNPKNLKTLATELNVSERTIRYEVEKIIEIANCQNLNIEIIKGYIQVKDFEKLEEILTENFDKTAFSFEERELYILLKILFDRVVNQVQLCEELDISRSTAKTHINDLKKLLDKYHLSLELCHKKGLELIGKEEDIRQCLLKFLTLVKEKKNIFFKNTLKKYFYINDEGIKKFLNYCQKIMTIVISDEAYEIITKYLRIAILMNKHGYKLDKIKNEKFLESTGEYEAIVKSSALLEAYYDIEFSKVEYLKIADYFLGSHTYNLKHSYYENWVEIELLVKRLIHKFNKRIDVDILMDDILLDGLLNHIKPTMYRIQNGIELENSIYLEVSESYPHLFQVAKESVKELEEFIGNTFSNDEIAFIVIHFKAAMDRNRVKSKTIKNVLLVCGFGYGTSKLLAQQLKELYSINIVEIVPYHLLEKIVFNEELDMIITTVDIDHEDISLPIIKVNPILSQDDIKNLKECNLQKSTKKVLFSKILNAVKNSCKEVDENLLLNNLKGILGTTLVDDILSKKITIFDMLKENMILENVSANTWEEAVKIAGNILIENNCADKNYVEDMIDCINKYGSYMVIIPEIAFPHARTNNNVKKSAFGVVNLKKPVFFPGNIPVKTIVTFCSKDNKEHLDAFIEIVDFMNQKNFNLKKLVKKI